MENPGYKQVRRIRKAYLAMISRLTRTTLLCLLFPVLISSCTADVDNSREGVVFYASFDKGVTADYAKGDRTGQPEGDSVKFQAGKRGQAFLPAMRIRSVPTP